MSNSRVAEFLNRAQNISKNTKVILQSKPLPNSIRTVNNSPISIKKSSLSPISYQSFSSTHDDTPLPMNSKYILAGPFKGKKTSSIICKEKIEKSTTKGTILKDPPETSEIFKGPPQKTQKKLLLTNFNINKTDEIKAQKNIDDQEINKNKIIEELESKNKKKIEKLIGIFKEEALKMDHKLKTLQEENKNLKEILANPQLPSAKTSLKSLKGILMSLSLTEPSTNFAGILEDFCVSYRKIKSVSSENEKISNWFECLQVPDSELKAFIECTSKKIVQEQQKRLKTEEETFKMIEYEENMIKELEAKVANAEIIARKASCRFIHETNEKEDIKFDRNLALENLTALIEKMNK